MRSVSIIGLPVAVTNYAGAVEWILAHAASRDHAYAVEAANTHVAALARADRAFGESMSRFDLIRPDGMPLIWAVNSKLPAGEKLTDRVYGPSLMLETIRASSHGDPSHVHFLLGGKSDTLARLTSRFATDFPQIRIGDTHSPPFGEWPESEFETIAEKIRNCGASFIWVGLGCPKQEHWIARNKNRLPPGVYFGIGAAFAFHAGEVRQAPPWIQRWGMEWAYRLAMEPRRLFKRYFTYNSLFLFYLIRDFLAGNPLPKGRP